MRLTGILVLALGLAVASAQPHDDDGHDLDDAHSPVENTEQCMASCEQYAYMRQLGYRPVDACKHGCLRYEVEATGSQAGPHTAACSTNCADQFANAALAEHCAWGCESYSHIQSSTHIFFSPPGNEPDSADRQFCMRECSKLYSNGRGLQECKGGCLDSSMLCLRNIRALAEESAALYAPTSRQYRPPFPTPESVQQTYQAQRIKLVACWLSFGMSERRMNDELARTACTRYCTAFGRVTVDKCDKCSGDVNTEVNNCQSVCTRLKSKAPPSEWLHTNDHQYYKHANRNWGHGLAGLGNVLGNAFLEGHSFHS